MAGTGARTPSGSSPREGEGGDLVIMGRVSGIYGLSGWIRVFSYTTPRSNILTYSHWHLYQAGRWDKRALLEGRVHAKGLVARIEGCGDRDQAMQLMAATIAVHREPDWN